MILDSLQAKSLGSGDFQALLTSRYYLISSADYTISPRITFD